MKIRILLLLLIFVSCKNNPPTPVKISYNILSNHVYTRMPGKLLLHKDHLIWHDPFASKDFIKIIDVRSGEQIGEAGAVGKGPEEFITPLTDNCIDDKIVVYDLNSPKQAFFDIDSILAGKKYFRALTHTNLHRPFIAVDSVSFVTANDSLTSPLQFIRKDTLIQCFGEPVIDGDFSNRSEYFQTNLFFDSNKGYFICLHPHLAHAALYRYDGERFHFLYRRKPAEKYKYSVQNREIRIEEPETKILDVAFTKEYIAMIEINKNDTKNTSRLPSVVYLYDYRFRLQHIIDLEIPLLRLAGDTRSGKLYAMAVPEGYSVIECPLPEKNMPLR